MDYSHSVTTLRDVPILYLAGAVDLESASQIVAELEELARTADRVVVDLTDVSFFDSAGLSALDQAQTTAATHGARIALACPNPKILRLFQITGLDDRFAISATAEEAVGL